MCQEMLWPVSVLLPEASNSNVQAVNKLLKHAMCEKIGSGEDYSKLQHAYMP